MNIALLIIDVQNAAEKRCVDFAGLIGNLEKMINSCRERNIPVIYTQDYATEKRKRRLENMEWPAKGTEGHDIAARIAPRKGDIVIEKTEYSAFFGTNLDAALKKLRVNRLLLAGLQAHICVQCTSADAYYLGYDVVAVRECITSTDEEKVRQGLRWIEKFTGRIVSIEDVFAD